MDQSFRPQRSDTRRSGTFFTALLNIFKMALHWLVWLVGFFQLTEEEQREAGIYLDRPFKE